MHRRFWWLRLVAVLGVCSAVLVACGGDDDDDDEGAQDAAPTEESAPAPAEGEPVQGGSLVVAVEAETNDWLPGTGNFAAGAGVAHAIYDPLLARDEAGELKPYLAESFESNADLTAWTIRLRPGVTFHDGTAFTAGVLEEIFTTYLTTETANTKNALADVERVEVVDDLTFVYHLSRSNAAFPDVLTRSAGMPFSVEAAKSFGPEAGANPVGTGPFVFESWQRDSEVVLRRNDSYWREGLPHLDQITFRVIVDEQTRLAALQAGDVDAIGTFFPATLAELNGMADDGELEVYANYSGQNRVTHFNVNYPPLDDARVRRALALAVDQTQLTTVFGDDVPTATQFYGSDSPWYSEAVAEAYPVEGDPEEAMRLLEEYRNDPERSDGKAVGEPLDITQYDCLTEQTLGESSELIRQFWSAIGIEVEVNPIEQATLVQNAVAGQNRHPHCSRLGGGTTDPYVLFSTQFGDPPVAGSNFSKWTDPRVHEQIALLRTSDDLDERKQAVEEIGMILVEEMPFFWNSGAATGLGVRPEIENIDGWTLPDGSLGDGHPDGRIRWIEVWKSS